MILLNHLMSKEKKPQPMRLDNLFIHHVYDILGAQLPSINNNNKHHLKEHNYFNTSYRHLGLRSVHTRVIDH